MCHKLLCGVLVYEASHRLLEQVCMYPGDPWVELPQPLYIYEVCCLLLHARYKCAADSRSSGAMWCVIVNRAHPS